MDKGKPKSSDNQKLTLENDQLGENKDNREASQQSCDCNKENK
ncbi:hypothetical protein Cpap_2022 [Ruminiclostridium papyrosolvens DSM 2782]|uniref:Uncharacterized protein n=1 Tax=Ruminiclostridium papyrosolvens DSM 2782 TaxID=588581 RepID=F1TDZ3_9FIRM|nr:hypothetical protein [Ruminiclostridium papyrosolvens]EGD47439.1 hypothetical protein Cpap_2022 [Ruminiclostridium papyrosolvens DSM 2782]WES34784.1 hypothetical protein P0092_02040 [Ruminiclostridium papyrosolvens DSM 2782]